MGLIKKPWEIVIENFPAILIYGPPGVSKSTLALSAPQPLHLDFDGGVHRVNERHRKDTVQVEKWEDINEVLDMDLSAYRSLIVDTGGKMIDFMTAFIAKHNPRLLQKDGSLSQKGFGARKQMFRMLLQKLKVMKIGLVIVAHDKEDKDGEEIFIRPDIGGSSGADLIRDLDLVGYIQPEGKNRYITFDPHPKFYGKNSMGLPARMLLPKVMIEDNKGDMKVNEEVKNNFLTVIFERFQKTQQERQANAVKYKELLDSLKKEISDVVNANGMNDAISKIKAMETHIWDSKLQASYYVRDRADELKLIFDAAAKTYSDPKKVREIPADTDKTTDKPGAGGKAKKKVVPDTAAAENPLLKSADND